MIRIILVLLAALSCGLAVAANRADLSWNAPAAYVDGTPIAADTVITYSIYQGGKGGAKTKLASTTTATTVAITSGLNTGTTYCWQISATANGVEGALSDEACKPFPFPAPGAPTGTTAR